MGKRRKDNSPGALSAEMREHVLTALARQAAAGSTTAAQLFLDEYNKLHNAGQAEALERLDRLIAEIDQLANS